MGLLSNKIHRSNLRSGDHIYSFRKWKSYSHHGIFVAENMVIHYTRSSSSADEAAKKKKWRVRKQPSCEICGYDPNMERSGVVVVSCLDCFLSGYNLYRFEYQVSYGHFLFKRSGTCSTGRCFPPDVAINHATALLSSERGFGEYNLFENNCESFAIYCKTGKHLSGQASSAKLTLKAAAKASSAKPTLQASAKYIIIEHKIQRLLHDVEVHDPGNHVLLKEKIDKLIRLPFRDIIAHLRRINRKEEEDELDDLEKMEEEEVEEDFAVEHSGSITID